MAVLALAWWAAALDEVSDDDKLYDALGDTMWVMRRIVARLPKAGGEGCGVKRVRGGSLDGVAAKR